MLSTGEYRLDFAAPRRRHDDAQRYTIWVLWLIGHSERTIANVMDLRVKQIAGIVGRSLYADRSGMTDQERQALLDDLRTVRIDGGKLDKVAWQIRPLGEAQLRGPLRRKIQRVA